MPPARLAVCAAAGSVPVLTAGALLSRTPPLWCAASAMVACLALLLGGALVLEWRMFADAIVRGPRGARGVVLTFDDGPHPHWTPRVLEVLRDRGVRATFFVIGRKAEAHPDVVRAILAQGHEVGLHSYAHDRLFALRSGRSVRADLERGMAVLEKVTGHRPALFRPPIGHTNPIVARAARRLELTVVGWSASGRDGVSFARADEVAARVRRNLRDGAIVLLHDSAERGEREPAAVRALPAILDAARECALPIVPLRQWLEERAGDGAGKTT